MQSNVVINIDDIKKAIRDDTILISIIHVNNEVVRFKILQPLVR